MCGGGRFGDGGDFEKKKKKYFFLIFFWGGGLGGGVGLGGQAGYKRRIEVFVKIKKKCFFFFGGGEVVGFGGQGGCERRLEVFMKNQKKKWGGAGRGGGRGRVGGVREDVIEELKFLGKFTKKIEGGSGEVRWGGGSGCWGWVRVDVN